MQGASAVRFKPASLGKWLLNLSRWTQILLAFTNGYLVLAVKLSFLNIRKWLSLSFTRICGRDLDGTIEIDRTVGHYCSSVVAAKEFAKCCTEQKKRKDGSPSTKVSQSWKKDAEETLTKSHWTRGHAGENRGTVAKYETTTTLKVPLGPVHKDQLDEPNPCNLASPTTKKTRTKTAMNERSFIEQIALNQWFSNFLPAMILSY